MSVLFKFNLASAIEYKTNIFGLILGTVLHNSIYLIFWDLFFDTFEQIKGFTISDIYLLFAVVSFANGANQLFVANTGVNLASLISQGKLDYYMTLPRSLVQHVIFSRMTIAGIGDMIFSLVAYTMSKQFHILDIILFVIVALLSTGVLTGVGLISGSLAFFFGRSTLLSQQITSAMNTFAFYPNGIFSESTRLILYTVIPASYVGFIPVEIIHEHNLLLLLGLFGIVFIIWLIAIAMFYTGMRKYESGNLIHSNL